PTFGEFTAATVDVSSTALTFQVSIDGASAQTVTIDSAAVTAYNSANDPGVSAATPLTPAHISTLATAPLTGATMSVNDDGDLVLTATAGNEGTASTIAISNTAGATGTGIAITTSATTGEAPTASDFTFDINGTTITLDAGEEYEPQDIVDAI